MTEFYPILSIGIVAIIIVLIKVVEKVKFQRLVGSQKATNVIIILLGIGEVIYLAISYKLLISAIETVTSLGVLLLFFTFIYLSKLQNAVSGLSIALSSRINVGDKVEVEGKKGTIVQIGLTKTIVKVDEPNKESYVFIPNKKFDEEVSVLTYDAKKRAAATEFEQSN